MTRKRVKHEQIPNESKRNAVFTKRVESLTKKANDLSVLCAVDVGMVIHKPAENNAVLWPSPEIFDQRMRKFLEFSELERAKKMVVHEKYLGQRLNDETEDMQRYHRSKELKESHQLMSQLWMQGKNFNDVDLVQLNGLQSFAADMMKKLQNRVEELNNEQEMQQMAPSPPGFPFGSGEPRGQSQPP